MNLRDHDQPKGPPIGQEISCSECGARVQIVYSRFHREIRTAWHRRTDDLYDHSTLFANGLKAEAYAESQFGVTEVENG